MCCAICSQRITGHYGTALGAGVHLELMGCVEALTQRAEAAEAAEKQFADAAQRWEDAYYAERAERDALRKDAARLDWLETQTEVGPADPDFPELTRRWLQVTGYENTLREIVDFQSAALAVQPTECKHQWAVIDTGSSGFPAKKRCALCTKQEAST